MDPGLAAAHPAALAGRDDQARAHRNLVYDPNCYLCPGNARSGGVHNPDYKSVFAFDNDFPALLPDEQPVPAPSPDDSPLLVAEPERGICRVLCFHPNHSLTLARMTVPEIATVVDAWAFETAALGERPFINHVQIFENRGAMMGASIRILTARSGPPNTSPTNPCASSPRCRSTTPSTTPACSATTSRPKSPSRPASSPRTISSSPSFLTGPSGRSRHMVLPRRHLGDFTALTPAERTALAAILKAVTTRYDNLFQVPFPYCLGFHQRPTHGQDNGCMHFHAHFYPPLLRSAEIRKFMVGFEMFAQPQRDLTPETAAARLRALPATHYAD